LAKLGSMTGEKVDPSGQALRVVIVLVVVVFLVVSVLVLIIVSILVVGVPVVVSVLVVQSQQLRDGHSPLFNLGAGVRRQGAVDAMKQRRSRGWHAPGGEASGGAATWRRLLHGARMWVREYGRVRDRGERVRDPGFAARAHKRGRVRARPAPHDAT
jgi:hypothetical protein